METNSDLEGRPRGTAGRLAYGTLRVAGGALRLVVYSVLSLLAPFFRVVLAFLALGGLITCLVFLAGPPHRHFPYAVMITISVVCAVLLVLLDLGMRRLSPESRERM
jgi:peptidoglycan/LPS O-acetylase OafA/YrhL